MSELMSFANQGVSVNLGQPTRTWGIHRVAPRMLSVHANGMGEQDTQEVDEGARWPLRAMVWTLMIGSGVLFCLGFIPHGPPGVRRINHSIASGELSGDSFYCAILVEYDRDYGWPIVMTTYRVTQEAQWQTKRADSQESIQKRKATLTQAVKSKLGVFPSPDANRSINWRAVAANFAIIVGGSLFVLVSIVAIRQERRQRRRAANQCVACGYSLTGLTEKRCPECGQPFG